MNYQKIHQVESAIKEIDLKVMEIFEVTKHYYGTCYDDEIESIKKKMLKLHEDSQEYQNNLIEIEKIFESHAKAFIEEVEKSLNEVSKKLSEKLNISQDIVKQRISKDLKNYNNDIDNLTLDETLDKIDDYLYIDEVNKNYFTK